MIQYKTLVAGSLQVNCYILFDDESREAFVIDPSGGADQIFYFLQDEKLTLKGILMTHGHGDHHEGLSALKALVDAPVYLHASDVYMAEDATINLSNQLYGPDSEFTPDVKLQDGMKLTLGQFVIRVIHTPGHTKGGVCYLTEGILFTGDTLFNGSVGRADLDGGDFEQLIKSIKNQLMKLADEVVVCPGHGPESSIGRERVRNPFLR